jgi:hypothetical protein
VPAPVALFVFNRPHLTARVLEAVAQARPPRLFVIGDGPRPDHPEDRPLVAETRALIDRVDWPCEVLTDFSPINLSCDRRIATGLEWLFGQVPEAIVLEDDCVPEASFFPFCAELLDRYRDDPRIQMISGCNVVGPKTGDSYYFSRAYHIWGWAGWARAWRYYDEDMRIWPWLKHTGWLKQHLGDSKGARIAELFFDGAHSGEMPQWDFYFAFSGWLRNAVAVTPNVNLVENIGYGDEATHQRDPGHPFAGIKTGPMVFPLVHPGKVEVWEAADQAVWEALFPVFPQFRRRGTPAQVARAAQGVLRRVGGAQNG